MAHCESGRLTAFFNKKNWIRINQPHAWQLGLRMYKVKIFFIALFFIYAMSLYAAGEPENVHPASKLAEKAIAQAKTADRSFRTIAQNALKALDINASKTDSVLVQFSQAMALKRMGERNQAMNLMLGAANEARVANASKLQYRIETQIGVMHRENREYDEAGKRFDEVLAASVMHEDSRHEVLILLEMGHLWFDQGRNAKALNHYTEARIKNDTLENLQLTAEIDQSIGSAYLKLGLLFKHINPEKSRIYFKESYRYNLIAYQAFEEMEQSYGSCYCIVNMLQTSLNLKQYSLADSIINQADFCYDIFDNHILLSLKMAQAKLYDFHQVPESAIGQLKLIMTTKYRFLAPVHYHQAYGQLAILARNQQKTDSAYRAATYVADWFSERGYALQAYEQYMLLGEWYEQDGMTEPALEYNKRAASLLQRLVADAGMEIFDELRYKYETELLLTKLNEVEQLESIQRRRFYMVSMFAGLMLISLAMALLLIVSQRKKALLMRQLADEKAAKIIHESKAKQLELEQIRIAHELTKKKAEANKLLTEKKEQELLLHTLRRTEIMQLLQNLLTSLAPFKPRISRKADREAFEALLKKLQRETTDNPMSQFEAVFKQAYGGFYNKLAESCPDLTRSEFQLAVLLRLNLTSKEIAHILNLSTTTIEKTRHQLRQKLKLKPKQQLTAWLMRMG